MSTVVHLNDYRRRQLYAACIACGKDWTHNALPNTKQFECPCCGLVAGEEVLAHPTFFTRFMEAAVGPRDRANRAAIINNACKEKEMPHDRTAHPLSP